MKFSWWKYGTIQGRVFPDRLVEARKHILTGEVQVKYREANETWNRKPAYAEVKPDCKKLFVSSAK